MPEDVVIQRHANATPNIAIHSDGDQSGIVRNEFHEFAGFVVQNVEDAIEVSYQVSADGETFYDLNDSDNNPVKHDITEDHCYTFPEETKPWPWLKLLVDDGNATAYLVRKG